MSSEISVVRQLMIAARALRTAEDELLPDTEYLRSELKELLEGVEILFEKLRVEHALLVMTEMLYGRSEELREVHSDASSGSTGPQS